MKERFSPVPKTLPAREPLPKTLVQITGEEKSPPSDPFARTELGTPPSSRDDVSAYDIPRLVKEQLSKVANLNAYKPKFLAQGGESIVGTFEDKNRHTVFKVNYLQSRELLDNVVRGWPIDAELENLERIRKQRIVELKTLRKYFGSAAIPAERQVIQDVPISKDLVIAIDPKMKDYADRIPETIPALVSLQRKVEFGDNPVFLRGDYPERRIHNFRNGGNEVYDHAHQLLTGGELPGFEDAADAEQVIFYQYPELQGVVKLMERDPSFRETLRDTVENMLAYMKETGTVLDLVGENFALVQKDGKWEVKIHDATVADGTSPMALSLKSLELGIKAQQANVPLAMVAPLSIANALNSVKMVNALAMLAGVPDRVTVPGLEKIPAQAWREQLAPLFVEQDSTENPQQLAA